MSNENIGAAAKAGGRPQLPQGPLYRHAYKSLLIAYGFMLLGGGGCLGLHRFYLGYKRSGLMLLILSLGAFLLPMIGIESVRLTWWVVTAWLIADLFLIPFMARKRNAEIAAEIDRELANRH